MPELPELRSKRRLHLSVCLLLLPVWVRRKEYFVIIIEKSKDSYTVVLLYIFIVPSLLIFIVTNPQASDSRLLHLASILWREKSFPLSLAFPYLPSPQFWK